MRLKSKFLLGLFVAMASLSLFAGQTAPKLLAVKFHADWCGSCKKMGDIFTDLTNKFDGSPVLFVTLDKTNITTKNQAELMVSSLGIDDAYDKNQGTGFILLLNPSSKKVITKLGANQSLKDMVKKIESVL